MKKPAFIKYIEKLTVMIFPEGAGSSGKTFRLRGLRLLFYAILYSLIVNIVGFYLIIFTPLESVFYPNWMKATTVEEQQFDELKQKIGDLAKEVEKLKTTNTRLKRAIFLGDSTMFDQSKKKTNESVKKKKISGEGNILVAVNALIQKYFSQDESDIIYFMMPLAGYVTKYFDLNSGHKGIDIAANNNSPIIATASGYITFADYSPKYGYTIIIGHSNGYISKYRHCGHLLKKEGELVEQGEMIALSGNSGIETTGHHLHFEIWRDGYALNPKEIIINFNGGTIEDKN